MERPSIIPAQYDLLKLPAAAALWCKLRCNTPLQEVLWELQLPVSWVKTRGSSRKNPCVISSNTLKPAKLSFRTEPFGITACSRKDQRSPAKNKNVGQNFTKIYICGYWITEGEEMRANCWYGKRDVRVEDVPDPRILNRQDAIVKVTSTAICGSDLHLYNGFMPTMEKGDILGHEFMGEIVEVGPEVKNRKVGDRVVTAFPISCGKCFFCKQQMFSLCENSNPNAWMAEKMFGHAPCGIFGYSHLTGGFAGGQAEYARVPFADIGPIKVPEYLSDEQVLFLSDIFPTGYMGAEMCDITPGDTIAIWGCGPVGQFSIRSAFLLGAERVIAIDAVPERLQMAEEGGAETINYEKQNVYEALMEMTGGRGPDACIDDVGMEAHTPGLMFAYDRV